MSCEAPTS